MTLRQQNLAKAIIGSKTLREAGLKAGYSKTSRHIYEKVTKSNIAKIFQAQGVTKDSLTDAYKECLRLCKDKKDYSTLKATIDSIAKLHNYLRDNNLQQVTVDISSTLDKLRQPKQPIDVNHSVKE